jgi:hypothetical protein
VTSQSAFGNGRKPIAELVLNLLALLRQWRTLKPMEFVRFTTFEKSAARIFSETEVLELELALTFNPDAGDLIREGRGLRKLRRPARGRGKRGGARVIYYFVTTTNQILLLYAYAKSEVGDLTKPMIRSLAATVKAEFP